MIVANATYRLAEIPHHPRFTTDDVDNVGREILRTIIDCADNPCANLPTVKELFDRHGTQYPYVASKRSSRSWDHAPRTRS